jgi:purine-binding chemotaxis protein CheW
MSVNTVAPKAAGSDVTRACSFRVGTVWLGVDVLHVQEVLLDQTLTGVPRAPKSVEGLLNLRGEILVTVDLRRRLNLGESENGANHVVVVLRFEHTRVGLLVDEVGDVVEVAGLRLEALPETATEGARDVICGAYQTDTSILHLLDVAVVTDLTRLAGGPGHADADE